MIIATYTNADAARRVSQMLNAGTHPTGVIEDNGRWSVVALDED